MPPTRDETSRALVALACWGLASVLRPLHKFARWAARYPLRAAVVAFVVYYGAVAVAVWYTIHVGPSGAWHVHQ